MDPSPQIKEEKPPTPQHQHNHHHHLHPQQQNQTLPPSRLDHNFQASQNSFQAHQLHALLSLQNKSNTGGATVAGGGDQRHGGSDQRHGGSDQRHDGSDHRHRLVGSRVSSPAFWQQQQQPAAVSDSSRLFQHQQTTAVSDSGHLFQQQQQQATAVTDSGHLFQQQQTTAVTDSGQLFQELALLFSENFSSDMNTPPSSVGSNNCNNNNNNSNSKLDKGGGVQQIKTENSPGSQSSNAVQQSHVSSSKPSFVANDLLGSILLKALNGFLFVVNSQGKVEFISENVSNYLKYSQDELVGKSIYNIIHYGDHPQFSHNLLPMTLASGLAWPSDSPTTRGCNFQCRMLIKPLVEEKDDVEVKQTHVSQYENMHITAFLQSSLAHKLSDQQFSSPHSKEDQSCLLCIARRLPINEKANMMTAGISQFSTKQDLSGKIILAETSQGMMNMEGVLLTDLCHANDIQQLKKHSQEVFKNGFHTSGVYRFRMVENRYVFVQTKSKLFNNHVTGDPEFVMSTHTVIRECDSENELRGSASTSLMKSIIGQSVSRSIPTSMGSMTVGQLASQPTPHLNVGGGDQMESAQTELDALAEWSDIFNNHQSDSADVKPIVPDGASSNHSNNSWDSLPTLKSPIHPNTPSPLQFALQTGPGSNSSSTRRPPMLTVNQRSSSVTSFDGSQKNAQMSPSPGIGPRSAGFSQRLSGSYPNQRSPASVGMGGNPIQNRNQGGQFAMGFQQRTPMSPLMSPQSVYPSSPAGWGRSPSSVTPTPPASSGDYVPSLNTPGSISLPSPLPNLSSQDSNSHSAMTSMDITLGRSLSSSGAYVSSPYLSSLSPSYSASMDLSNLQLQTTVSTVGSNNAGMSSHRLCQLLTQNTAPDPFNSNTTTEGRRPIINRSLQMSNPMGTVMPTLSSVSSTNSSSVATSGSLAGLGMDMYQPTSTSGLMRSPEDHLHQSPTEGPGQSPPQKPQSTSEDGEGELLNMSGIGSSSGGRVKGGVHGNSGSGTSSISCGERSTNLILKSLLSQEDDDEQPAMLDSAGASLPGSSGSLSASSIDFHILGDKNEAEPRKNNVLLKKLLRESKEANRKDLDERLRREIEHATKTSSSSSPFPKTATLGTAAAGATTTAGSTSLAPGLVTKKRKPATGMELLNQLLENNEEEEGGPVTTSAPAESTSSEPETDSGVRSRHQSEHLEPHPTSTSASHSEPCTPQGQMMQKRGSDSARRDSQHLDELLHNLWSKEDSSPKHHQQAPSSSSNNSSTKRRKIFQSDVDSSDGVGMDVEPTTSSLAGPDSVAAAHQSELSQRNQLLSQLLSKRTNKETVVNTNISINPTGIPQNRYPRNLSDKIITIAPIVNPENISTDKISPEEDGQGSIVPVSVSSSNIGTSVSMPSSSSSSGSSINSNNMPSFLSSAFISSQPSLERDSSLNGLDVISTDSQLRQFQSLLDSEGAMFCGDSAVSESGISQVDSTENDPLLQQILQQAADLHEDLQKMGSTTSMNLTPQSSSVPMSLPSSNSSMSSSSLDVLKINTNLASVNSIAQSLSSSVQPSMQNRLHLLQQQQQQQQQQPTQDRLHLLSSQRAVQQQLLQQKQQLLLQKTADNKNLLPLSHQQQHHQPFLSPPQQPSSSTLLISQSSLSGASLSPSSVSSSSASLVQNLQMGPSVLAEMDVDDETNLVAQLEEIFKETGNWPNMDNVFMPNLNQSRQDQSNEQLAIDGIKRQLMGEESLMSSHQQQQMLGGVMDHSIMNNRQNLQGLQGGLSPQQQLAQMSMSPGQMLPSYGSSPPGPASRGMQGQFSPGLPGLRPQQQQQQQRQQQQQQLLQQQQHLLQQQSQAGFTPPRGPLATALQTGMSQLRPTGLNTAMMVRQNLLYQQRHRQIDRQKQDREKQQRLMQLQQQQQLQQQHQQQQQQQHQQQHQQQQRLQGLSQNYNQRFNQNLPPSVESPVGGQPPFPDNLRELMTQGHPPNVTLPVQRTSGMSGPMSPRFPSPQASQLSPHFSPQSGSSGVWGMRSQGNHADPALVIQQGNQFSPSMNRQRSLSGNSLANPGNQQQQMQARFQFTDGSQFCSPASNASQLSGLFSPPPSQQQPQQQQQSQQGTSSLYPQSRLMQRLPAGHGSPRAPLSPYGASPTDPLLVSPQGVISPNSGMRPSPQSGVQVSPQYNQTGSSSGYGGPAMSSGPFSSSLPPGVSSFSPSGSMAASTVNTLHELELQFFDNTINSMESKNMMNDIGMSGAGPSTSQYVKQELRNICSARSEKQQQQQHAQLQSQDFDSLSSELPPDILETITDMSKEHGGPLSNPMDDSEAMSQVRLETRRQFEQYQRLSGHSASDSSEEAGVKATNFFRSQLLQPVQGSSSPVSNSMKLLAQTSMKGGDSVQSQMNLLQSDGRPPSDEMRLTDNRNSLLCQLLSE